MEIDVKMDDSFIGSVIETEVNTFTVKADALLNKRNKYYIAECSICSKDEELWPYGSIVALKETLRYKGTPCGCRKFVKWKKWQYKLMVERECDKRGYIFHGFIGEYKHSKTRLDLENPSTGNRWDKATVNSLLSGQGDILEGFIKTQESCIRPDNYYINKFIETGSFLKGTRFKRLDPENQKANRKWEYTCPVCSNDEYVENGLCSGVFQADVTSLNRGFRSCRCGVYRWNKDQRRYQIEKILKSEGNNSTITWLDEYKNGKSRFHYSCPNGHNHVSGVSDFLNGHRCKCVSRRGFDITKAGTFYIVEWVGFGESYIKIGITNLETIERVKQQFSKSKLDYKILKEISNSDGSVIYNFERFIKTDFCKEFDHKIGVCNDQWLPDGYIETFENSTKLLSDLEYVLKREGIVCT